MISVITSEMWLSEINCWQTPVSPCVHQGGELHVRKRRPVEKSRKPGDCQQVMSTQTHTQADTSVVSLSCLWTHWSGPESFITLQLTCNDVWISITWKQTGEECRLIIWESNGLRCNRSGETSPSIFFVISPTKIRRKLNNFDLWVRTLWLSCSHRLQRTKAL